MLFCCLLLSVCPVAALAEADPLPYRNVSNEELEELISSGADLIDIRRPEEWRQTGVIEGSHLLPAFDRRGRFKSDFPRQLAQIVDRDEPVILLCRVGNRSSLLSRAMAKQGYEKVYNVTDGIMGWIADDRPVTQELDY